MPNTKDKTRQEELRASWSLELFTFMRDSSEAHGDTKSDSTEWLDEATKLVNQQVLAALDKVKSTAVENVNGAMVVGVHSIEDIEKEYKV